MALVDQHGNAGSQPRERPILFSGPMVRAILAGQKTQTRRIVRDPKRLEGKMLLGEEGAWCPYGAPGDRLWVRETWYCDHVHVGDLETTRRTYIGRTLTDQECIAEWRGHPDPLAHVPEGHMMYYRADGELTEQIEQCEQPNCWRPSIHMPRWASRITLEVTGVRVERLQDISEEDAKAEGITDQQIIREGLPTKRFGFSYLWDQINEKRAPWSSNPWAWVIEFRRA